MVSTGETEDLAKWIIVLLNAIFNGKFQIVHTLN